ncbi:ATP-binding protein [Vibrio ostreicida]|uniref:histidine kinase n=1 Tax=Vibrio ostreicida TaxID=526588 RepID=A0ABT8BVF6_9VIBR|nr:ATP-binding protein [Vibrio ostreicida]MDN3610767.1 ATP-binding protein [Vibrio ostreicida]NPD07238.1 sensor histidine kinase [Vibrio ostreicida]
MMGQHRGWFLLVASLLMGLAKWAGEEAATQWQLEQFRQEVGQNLLNYIIEVRRSLKRFSPLPYLIAHDTLSQRYLRGNTTLRPQVEKQLIQLDKAANTKGWYLLSKQGEVMVSSKENSSISHSDSHAIAAKISQERDHVSIVTKSRGETPEYFLAAPVYLGLEVAGIAAIKVDLSLLHDQWVTNKDMVWFQNSRAQFFLPFSKSLNYRWLNRSFHKKTSEIVTLHNQTQITLWQLNQQKYLSQSVTLDDLGWQLTYLKSIASLDQTVRWVGWLSALMCLFILLLFVIRYQGHQKKIHAIHMQALIEQSEKRLSGMINKTHVSLLLLDQHGAIQTLNPMAKRDFNLSDGMLPYLEAWQLFDTGNPNSTALQLLHNLAQHGELAEVSRVETMAQRSDGSHFPVLFSISPFAWYSSYYYLCTVIDISKRKQAEVALESANQQLQKRVEERTQALKQAQEDLIEASKLAALGKMSSAITHEFNQPLTGLKTLLSSNQLLLERGETAKLNANMKLVQTLIDRMVSMTSQLKSFAFKRLDYNQPISLIQVVEEVLLLEQDALNTIEVRLRIKPECAQVMGDEGLLRQVIGNLISNAIDAIKDQTLPHITINAHRQNQQVNVEVIDNGCGVDPSRLPHIFEPFQTNKKVGEGLGLGLAITANHLKEMQGHVWAKNNTKAGMTFTLTLEAVPSKSDEFPS